MSCSSYQEQSKEIWTHKRYTADVEVSCHKLLCCQSQETLPFPLHTCKNKLCTKNRRSKNFVESGPAHTQTWKYCPGNITLSWISGQERVLWCRLRARVANGIILCCYISCLPVWKVTNFIHTIVHATILKCNYYNHTVHAAIAYSTPGRLYQNGLWLCWTCYFDKMTAYWAEGYEFKSLSTYLKLFI